MAGIRVLIVDDSPVYRVVLRRVLRGFANVAEVRVACDGLEALKTVKTFKPDLVLLDLDMPRLGGVEVSRVVRQTSPETSVVIISGVSGDSADLTFKALDAGALDFICKPTGKDSEQSNEILARRLAPYVAFASLRGGGHEASEAKASPPAEGPVAPESFGLVVVGASAGAPGALAKVVENLPEDLAVPVLVVVPMPSTFTRFVSFHWGAKTSLAVVEASDGEILEGGKIYVSPGERRVEVSPGDRPQTFRVRVRDIVSLSGGGCPVDALLQSAARAGASGVLAVIMTGLGEDGLAGVRDLKAGGGNYCLVQSPETSIAPSMPNAILSANLADEVVPLDEIGGRLADLVRRR